MGSKESNEASFVWYLQGLLLQWKGCNVENIMVVAPWYTVDRHADMFNLQVDIFLMFNLPRLYCIPYSLRASQASSFRIANRGASTIFLSLSGTRVFPPKHLCDVGPMPIAQVRAGLFPTNHSLEIDRISCLCNGALKPQQWV